nr:hypothetical protein [Mycobacterium attenuatum]
MIVSGNLVKAKRLGLYGDLNHLVGRGERDRVGHTGQTRRYVDAELHA